MQPTLLDMIIKAESEEEAMENITYTVAYTYMSENGNYINNYINFDNLGDSLFRMKNEIDDGCKSVCLWAKYPEREHHIALCQYTNMQPCFMIFANAYSLLSGDVIKDIYDAICDKHNI